MQTVALALLFSLGVFFATLSFEFQPDSEKFHQKINIYLSIATPLGVLAIILRAYFPCIIYSHYVQMREQEKRQNVHIGVHIPTAPGMTMWTLNNYEINTFGIS